ncbi:MAG: hypothetical protein DRJ05_12685 [Bacteroidetes bacterium]|nr:MAG: hypothetical protein DRJ05_12685 [Bacteroidota bacterium]
MDKKTKCLVVDDEKHFLLYLEILFEHNGYEVFSSLNVDDALDIIKKEEIEFIISDINMPEKDGFLFLSEIKSNSNTHNIPFLVVSNDDSKGVINRVMDMGAIGFMRKPLLQHHLKKVSEMIAHNN